MRDAVLAIVGLVELLVRFVIVGFLTLVSVGLIWLMIDIEDVIEPTIWRKL